MPERISLYRGKFIELARIGTWEFAHRVTGQFAVCIFALTPDRHILLISQFRIPVNHTVLEIPAGLIGDSHPGETWQTGARRELEEETGYTADTFQELTYGPTSGGLTTECIKYVLAQNIRHIGDQQPDGDEQITLHKVPLDQVDDFIQSQLKLGHLIDPKIYIGLYFIRQMGL